MAEKFDDEASSGSYRTGEVMDMKMVVRHKDLKEIVEPDTLPWTSRIHFHRLNIKHDSRLEGLIRMVDLTINLAAICTPADYNTRPLNTIYSNFIDALPVVIHSQLSAQDISRSHQESHCKTCCKLSLHGDS